MSAADLNGDGLVDLWGEVDGELRAFRGEAPEAWHVLGQFKPATATDPNSDSTKSSSADLDRDGVADTLIAGLEAPVHAFDLTGGQLPSLRSGRDGRVIWKAAIDPRGSWHLPNSGNAYELVAFPLPGGDIDGDGTPDVIVSERPGLAGMSSRSEFEDPSIELLSGQTGARLWSVGPLPDKPGNIGLSERLDGPARDRARHQAGSDHPRLPAPGSSCIAQDFGPRRPGPLGFSDLGRPKLLCAVASVHRRVSPISTATVCCPC